MGTKKPGTMAGRVRLWVGRSSGFDQPFGFVNHSMASAAGDSTPREVVDPGNCCAVWAGNDAAIATGTGEPVNFAGVHAIARRMADSARRLAVPCAKKAMMTRRPRF